MGLGTLLLVATIASATFAATATRDDELFAMGFASCNKHDRDQSYWDVVGKALPARRASAKGNAADGVVDAFVWLGDVVYNDHSPFMGVWRSIEVPLMQKKLVDFHDSPRYSGFVAQHVRKDAHGKPAVFGVWDDHDMGKNDGGVEYADKAASQDLFLDFLDVPKDHPRRTLPGVYTLHGVQWPQRDESAPASVKELQERYPYAVCTILLDGRYGRDPIGSDGNMLGEEQWSWLERALVEPSEASFGGISLGRGPLFSRCALTVIGSGVQVIADEKPTEHWGHFPTARQRLFQLLHKHRAERFVFVSGDVHYSEIQVEESSPFGFPIVEVTSSGLTHAMGDFLPNFAFDVTCASPRRHARYLPRNFGRVALTVDRAGVVNVNLTVHSARTGDAMISYARPVNKLQFTGDSTAPCGEACAFAVHEGLLKWFLFGLRRRFAPDWPVHRVLVTFAFVVWAVVGTIAFFSCRWTYRRIRGRSASPKKRD